MHRINRGYRGLSLLAALYGDRVLSAAAILTTLLLAVWLQAA
jgi:hypothetical protein